MVEEPDGIYMKLVQNNESIGVLHEFIQTIQASTIQRVDGWKELFARVEQENVFCLREEYHLRYTVMPSGWGCEYPCIYGIIFKLKKID